MALLLASPLAALDLPSNARLTAERLSSQDRYSLPIGPFANGTLPTVQIDGAVKRQAWKIPGQGLTSLQIAAPLQSELEASGFNLALDCLAETCGGFDFRFATEVLPAPNMYVNLRDYQFLSFTKGFQSEPTAAVGLLLSTSRDGIYVQIIEVQEGGAFETNTQASGAVARPVARPTRPSQKDLPVPADNVDDLFGSGGAVLAGVDFGTGETALGEGPFPALEDLAAFLKDNPNITVAVVGHTDSVGSLEGNTRISKARAQSVRQKLVEVYGANAAQIEAEGAGYLSPIASNLTEEGRTANRRVEVVILRDQ